MSIIAAALKHMLAAGLPHETILAAVADMEANLSKDEAAERRRAKDRERKSNIPRNSADSAEVVEPTPSLPPNGPLSFPQTPILSPLNPPNPPTASGEIVHFPKRQNRKQKTRGPAYSGDFELWWAEYPRTKAVSKSDAFTSFDRLTTEDQDAAIEGAIAYASLCRTEATPERFICHPAVFLNQRRWETLGPVREAAR